MSAFLALADPTRRTIVEILSAGPLPAGEIASRFNLSPPAISQHLRVLREARIVDMRADAQRRIYQLGGAGLREVDEWVSRYRKFWFTALDALDDALDAELRAELAVTDKDKNRKASRKAIRKERNRQARRSKI